MLKSKAKRQKFTAILLALSFIFAILPSDVSALAPMEQQALNEANSLRAIIMRDVPECTWTEDTVTAHTTVLYDVYGEVNGYLYEYANGTTPAGFMQIDTSLGTPMLDSYSFGGEHPAAKEYRTLPDKLIDSTTLVYSASSYLLLGEAQNGTANAYNLLRKESTTLNTLEFAEQYDTALEAKRTARAEQLASVDSEVMPRTVTVYVTNYTSSLSPMTYATSPYGEDTDCARISCVNACKYWALRRGKTGLYTNDTTTYNDIAQRMSVCGSVTWENARDGLYAHMQSKGHSPTVQGTIEFTSGTVLSKWTEITGVINIGVPLNLVYYIGGNSSHVVLVLGYQTATNSFMLFLADPQYSSPRYISADSLLVSIYSKSFYLGWN